MLLLNAREIALFYIIPSVSRFVQYTAENQIIILRDNVPWNTYAHSSGGGDALWFHEVRRGNRDNKSFVRFPEFRFVNITNLKFRDTSATSPHCSGKPGWRIVCSGVKKTAANGGSSGAENQYPCPPVRFL